MGYNKAQKLICERYSSPFCESPGIMKVGISQNVRKGILPINGLRHPLQGDTSGWYIWAGEYSTDPDFFVPLHVEHVEEWCPIVLKYLALAPVWRFLVDNNYEDVWQDITLLDV